MPILFLPFISVVEAPKFPYLQLRQWVALSKFRLLQDIHN